MSVRQLEKEKKANILGLTKFSFGCGGAQLSGVGKRKKGKTMLVLASFAKTILAQKKWP